MSGTRVAPAVMGIALSALVLACGTPPSDLDVKLDVASGQLGLVRQVSWPGGGTEVTVKVSDPSGGPLTADVASAFRVSRSGSLLESERVRVERELLGVGSTALLVKLAETPALRMRQADELERFVRERPASERIGVFLWGEAVTQVANFTLDRDRLAAKFELLATFEAPAVALDFDAALLVVDENVASVGGRAPRGMRAVVVSGADSVEPPPSRSAVVMGTAQASARMAEFASSSYYRVAVCAGEPGAQLKLEVDGAEGELPVLLAKALPESSEMPCDVAAMGPGLRDYPERIDLVFSDAQRAVYDDRAAALSKADFGLSVRIDGSAAITASAHLRGKGTLGCERKSYTLSLDGAGRHWLPESRTDEFYLLSMCADDRYVEQYTANQLLSELGLFPLAFRLVEVALDGQTRGVYLLLEKPREELVRDGTGIHDVMRRRFETNPPADYFESKFSTGLFDAAALYSTAAAADIAAMQDEVSLDPYLRFLALMTAYQNGDYIDEIWVTASEQRLGAEQGLWFETMAWDNDDLFSECHYSGQFAFVDPNALVYCAEATIDHVLLGDPAIYNRYVDILEDLLLRQVPPERFDVAADATEAAILPMLSRDGVSAAMVRLIEDNPEAVEPAEAQRDVSAKLADLRNLYRSRHAELLARIATYRGAAP